jgi:hypothetical protein
LPDTGTGFLARDKKGQENAISNDLKEHITVF